MAEAATVKKTTKKDPEIASEAPKTASKKENKATFAVLATGGKQYRVKEGSIIKIEKLSDKNYTIGDAVTFDSVLLTDDGASSISLGAPFIKGSYITGKITKISRNKTIDVIKYKQKSRYFKKYGHRQPYFEVQIDTIK